MLWSIRAKWCAPLPVLSCSNFSSKPNLHDHHKRLALLKAWLKITKNIFRMAAGFHEQNNSTMSFDLLCCPFRQKTYAFRHFIWISAYIHGSSRQCQMTCALLIYCWPSSQEVVEKVQHSQLFTDAAMLSTNLATKTKQQEELQVQTALLEIQV